MLAMFKKFLVAVLSLFLVVGSASAASASTHKAVSHRVHVKPAGEQWTHVKPLGEQWTGEQWTHVKPLGEQWTGEQWTHVKPLGEQWTGRKF